MFARRPTRPTLSLTRRRSADGDDAARSALAEAAKRRPSFEPFERCVPRCVCVAGWSSPPALGCPGGCRRTCSRRMTLTLTLMWAVWRTPRLMALRKLPLLPRPCPRRPAALASRVPQPKHQGLPSRRVLLAACSTLPRTRKPAGCYSDVGYRDIAALVKPQVSLASLRGSGMCSAMSRRRTCNGATHRMIGTRSYAEGNLNQWPVSRQN